MLEEIRLPGWVGPTFFTPEPTGGTLVTFAPKLAKHRLAEAQVIGTIRETEGKKPTPYAAFVVQGQVYVVDLKRPNKVRYVNADLERFEKSVAAFVAAWRVPGVDLKAQLAAIEPRAVAGADSFWSTWIETANAPAA